MNYTFGMMKKLKWLLITALLIIVSATTVQAQQKASYEVKQGDTLYGISKKLNVTIAELKQWNALNSNEIELGQELTYYIQDATNSEDTDLPENNSDPLVSRSSNVQNEYYTVKSGDTLYEISLKHGMTVDQLKDLNNLTSNSINVGQRLAVRKQSVAPPSVSGFTEKSSPQGVFSVYELERGEDLSTLLRKFKMTENEFQKLNPELDLSRLGTGQEVTVLLPPSRSYANPYLQKANLSNLGDVPVSKYADTEEGETTTSGELYASDGLTAAHSNIALGTLVFVENPQTGNGVYVRINDRVTGSGLKLSQKAYSVLNLQQVNQPTVTIYTEGND